MFIQVNSQDLSAASHDEAVEVIKRAKSPVNLSVIYNPEGKFRIHYKGEDNILFFLTFWIIAFRF